MALRTYVDSIGEFFAGCRKDLTLTSVRTSSSIYIYDAFPVSYDDQMGIYYASHTGLQRQDAVLVSSKEVLDHNTLTILIRLILLLPPMQIVLRRRIKDIEKPLPLIADLEHARHVPTPVAIVGRAPDGAQSIVIEDLISLLTELVRAEDVGHFVDVQELLDDLCAESVARASRRQRELIPLGIGIAPDQICHGTLVRNLPEAIDDLDLVDAVYARTQAAVHAEYLVVDHDGQREEVEHVGEVVPDVGVAVFAVAFGVEAIGLRYASRLVVPSD